MRRGLRDPRPKTNAPAERADAPSSTDSPSSDEVGRPGRRERAGIVRAYPGRTGTGLRRRRGRGSVWRVLFSFRYLGVLRKIIAASIAPCTAGSADEVLGGYTNFVTFQFGARVSTGFATREHLPSLAQLFRFFNTHSGNMRWSGFLTSRFGPL